MAIQMQGNGGVTAEVESNTRALRSVLRPTDFGALGVYQATHVSGVMAAGLAASAEIFQLRWTHASNLCLIRQVQISAASDTVAFTAGRGNFNLAVARSWTADGSGGTAMTLTGNNQKLRTSMGTTLMGAIRGASTAALTAGTKTLDTQALSSVQVVCPAAAATLMLGQIDMINPESESEYPIVLAQNEGIVIRATVAATGTWGFSVNIKWMELASY